MSNVITANTNDNRIIIINLAISALASERQIDLNTLGIKVEELPEATKKLLKEKIFPKEFLRAYNHLREQAETAVSAGGSTKTDLGAVTSFAEAIDKVKTLKELQAQWEKRKADDASRYDDLIAEHVLSVSQEAIKGGADPQQVNILVTAIQGKQPTWEAVASKLTFSYTITPVTLDENEFDAELFEAQRDSVVAIREGVLGSLVQHVCREAKEMLENLQKQEKNKGTVNLRVNPRTVERARNMQAKLKSLAFIHPLIRPLHTEIAAILDKVSDTEALVGREYLAFKEICLALRDQTLVLQRLQSGTPLIHVATPTASLSATAPAASSGNAVIQPAAQAPVVAPASQVTASVQASGVSQAASSAPASANAPTTSAPAGEEEAEAEVTAPVTPAAEAPNAGMQMLFL